MIDRLNCEIQRRISVIRIFPNENSYVRLLTTYLMVLEYAEKRSISRVYPIQEAITAALFTAT